MNPYQQAFIDGFVTGMEKAAAQFDVEPSKMTSEQKVDFAKRQKEGKRYLKKHPMGMTPVKGPSRVLELAKKYGPAAGAGALGLGAGAGLMALLRQRKKEAE